MLGIAIDDKIDDGLVKSVENDQTGSIWATQYLQESINNPAQQIQWDGEYNPELGPYGGWTYQPHAYGALNK